MLASCPEASGPKRSERARRPRRETLIALFGKAGSKIIESGAIRRATDTVPRIKRTRGARPSLRPQRLDRINSCRALPGPFVLPER